MIESVLFNTLVIWKLVERKHQHILNVARAIFQSQLPFCFCSYVVKHAVHLINRTSTLLLHDKSPYQMVYNEIPNLSHIKKIGCLDFSTTSSVQRIKLSSRARKCVFLGYKYGVKSFTLFYMNRKNIFVTRDVIFYENHFPFYKDNIDTNLDTHDVFNNLLPSISDNDIVLPTSISDIVSSVSENVLQSSLPATGSSTPLYLIDIDVLQHQHSNPQPSSTT